MNNWNNENQATKIVHQVWQLTFYEVQEEELDIIKAWPRNNFPLLIDISIFLFWVFFTALLTLLTWTNFKDKIYEILYLSILFSSLIIGIIMLILYFLIKRENSFEKTIEKIISRKK